MGNITEPQKVKLFIGALSADVELFDNLSAELGRRIGEIDEISQIMVFNFTDYYTASMGPDLRKVFFSIKNLIDPARLAEIKILTNQIEQEFAVGYKRDAIPRPVNLDPGYIEASKLVLASTKNYSHRIYIGQGIYAEVTLMFSKHAVKTLDWTFPDYKSGLYDSFFLEVRERYMEQITG